jgi:hypothetical protein
MTNPKQTTSSEGDTPQEKAKKVTQNDTFLTDREMTSIKARFNRVVARAKAALIWERSWPKIVPALCIGGAFLTVSWLGVWPLLPPAVKAGAVIAAATAAVVSPFLIRSGSPLVSRFDAVCRIDAHTAPKEKPAIKLADKLSGSEKEKSEYLWRAQFNRLWTEWGGKLKAGRAKPDMKRFDPYAMRYVVAVCAGLSAVYAGDARQERIMEAFDWSSPVVVETLPTVDPVIRAWITPPEGVDAAPVYLRIPSLSNAADNDVEAPREETPSEETPSAETSGAQTPSTPILEVHEQSRLTLVVSGYDKPVLSVNGTDYNADREVISYADDVKDAQGNPLPITTYHFDVALEEGASEIVLSSGHRWSVNVLSDQDPTVTLNAVGLQPNEDGGTPNVAIQCEAEDDFGVRSGQVILRLPQEQLNEAAQRLDSATIPAVRLPRGRACSR